MKTPKYLSILSLAVIGALYGASPALAMPSLGTDLPTFAVLAGSTVTNTGTTIINGDLGVYTGTSITGFPPGTVNGTIHLTDAVAQQAQLDANHAYIDLAAMPNTTHYSGDTQLGGLTLYPGVYYFDSSAQLTGALNLDFTPHPDQPFVFQIGSTLTTASGSSVNVKNGSANSGVFWNVFSSATLGTGTQFAGNILALQSITLNTGADILGGRAIALSGAVTMDNNTITAVPEPETYAMLLAGLGLLGFTAYRRKSLDV
jgi:hypothetical protein